MTGTKVLLRLSAVQKLNDTPPEFETHHAERGNLKMRKHNFAFVLALLTAFLVQAGFAQKITELNPFAGMFPTKSRYFSRYIGPGGGSGGSLSYHGGATITNAKVIPIFWGPSWGSGGSDYAKGVSIQQYVNVFGTSGEYNVITQYSGIQQSNLASAGTAIYDGSTPPANVTDAILQGEVKKYATRSDVVYEVFLPSSSYASSGTATSCGGPNLTFCAYHGNFSSGSTDVKYASMPYPSCGGCQTSGFSVTQNFEHFISHETREAVTDPDGTAWYDRRGQEADDKCAWSPTPFTDANNGTNQDGTAFAYQYEWSNANSGCVKVR